MAKVFNPPERIYLQVGDIDRDCEFAECERSEVTWCADPIHDTDIEYRLVKRQRSVGKCASTQIGMDQLVRPQPTASERQP